MSRCARPSPWRCPTRTCSRRRSSAAARRSTTRPGPTAPPSGELPACRSADQDRPREGQGSCWPKRAIPNGFSTTFAFNVGQAATAEPMAALVKESLAKIGIKVEIQKMPDAADVNTLINEKKMPFFTDGIDRLAALDRLLLLPQLLHRRPALELLARCNEPKMDGADAQTPASRPTRPSTRTTASR